MKNKILSASVLLANVLPISAFAASSTISDPDTVTQKACSGENCITDVIRNIGGWLLGIAGVVAVVFLIIGGVRYIASAGNPAQTEGAKKTIIYALVGLGIIVLSLVLINVVLAVLNK